jgi:citrate synthase
MGRIPGWTIHIIEQYESKGILRPRLYYDGPMDMEYKPVEDR